MAEINIDSVNSKWASVINPITDNHFIVKPTDPGVGCGVELAGWHDNDGPAQKIAAHWGKKQKTEGKIWLRIRR